MSSPFPLDMIRCGFAHLLTTEQVPIVGSVAMLYYKHVRKLSMRLRDLDSEAQAFAQARLANVRTVRAFANESLEAQRFQQVRPSLFKTQMESVVLDFIQVENICLRGKLYFPTSH